MWNFVRFDDKHVSGVCGLWNKEIGSRFPMRERLLRQNGSEHAALLREGSLVVCDDEYAKIIGAVISKQADTDTGHISMLLVDSEYRGRGIGSLLLYLAEQTLIRCGVRQISMGTDPGHFLPGIPADDEMTKTWLGQKGYIHTGTTHDLLGDFRGAWDGDPTEECKGVTFSTADGKDRAPLLAFLGRSFPGRWEQSTRDYFAAGGTGREFVIAKKDDGEIIGFCRVNDEQAPVLAANQFWSPCFDEPSAGIGPLGIAEAYRSSGYGRALLQAAMHVLFERGIRLIVIDWTSAISFYGKLGFHVWKSYDFYNRQV